MKPQGTALSMREVRKPFSWKLCWYKKVFWAVNSNLLMIQITTCTMLIRTD